MTEMVVAVTKHGLLSYRTVEDALASAFVRLEDPIFSEHRRIDKTLVPGLASQDPWSYLVEHATVPVEPPPRLTKKRAEPAPPPDVL